MIPPVAHFIWLGPTLPWVNVLAIRSAAQAGEYDRLVFHHDQDLSGTPHWPELKRVTTLETRALKPHILFERAGAPRLGSVYKTLESPSARANVLRAAILLGEGGVYLDMDTVTVRSIRPLLGTGAFCGEERLTLPATVAHSRRVLPRVHALWLQAVREGCRILPGGWALFRKVEVAFPTAVNNAVLASRPGHPLMAALVEAMQQMPLQRRTKRYALGTHLLQECVARYLGTDLQVHPPEVFYPLGPEVSQHWFRKQAPAALQNMLCPNTRVVHWYASVRTRHIVPRIDPQYVREHAATQPFCELAMRYL